MDTIVGIHQVDEVPYDVGTSVALDIFVPVFGYQLVQHGKHLAKHSSEVETSCPMAICVCFLLNESHHQFLV